MVPPRLVLDPSREIGLCNMLIVDDIKREISLYEAE